MRAIQPGKSLLTQPEEPQGQKYRTDLPCYQYIRFSTDGQVKKSWASKIQQDQRLNEKLVRIGFTDIRKKEADEGKSGQKRVDERTDLADIYAAMKAVQCGAVAAFDASRLWRDRTQVYHNEFIQMLIKYDVPCILANRTYWPRVKDDMEALRQEFVYAQKALDQFYDKANPARMEAVSSGSYGGHALSPGFVVVGDKGAKQFVVYEPHAQAMRCLYKRYRQLSGNLGRLGRELVRVDYHLPDFDKDLLRDMGASVPHLALTHDSKGYKLQSRNGLISVLTQVAYIGWYVFDGVLVDENAYPVIVDRDDFEYAYERLSPIKLNGEKNEKKPVVNRSYSQVNALLEGLLTSNGAPCYAMAIGSYVARLNNDGWKSAELVVTIADLDDAFATSMVAMLAILELKKEQHKSLADKVDALIAEQEEKVSDFAGTLANIDKAIRQWEVAKQAAMAAESVPDTTEAIKNLKRLRADRDAIAAKANQASREVNLLAECGNLLECAVNAWSEMGFEKQRRLVKLLVGYAEVTEAAPHILKLTVALTEPVNHVLYCYLWRARGGKSPWTDKENAILRRLYPSADRAVILEALPARTWDSIMQQVSNVLHLERATRANTSGIPDSSTFADVQLMRKLGIRTRAANFSPHFKQHLMPGIHGKAGPWPHWTSDANQKLIEHLLAKAKGFCRERPARQ